MEIKFRNYENTAGITSDYHKVRAFFVKLGYAEFTYTRWDWMITHSYLDRNAVGKIGLWEIENEIVGVATFDCRLGTGYCLTLPEFTYLKKEMLLYAKDNLSDNGEFGIVISDNDRDFQQIAYALGFIATKDKESDAIIYTENANLDYSLPEGFSITSLDETYDAYKYLEVLWKGFNHELNGEGKLKITSEDIDMFEESMKRPNVDLHLKVAVVNDKGDFVSYCGMWYEPKLGMAVIEPVATVPEYRKLGLGKAAVLEGVKRVGELGAKMVLVGSSQQFYYSIGMFPYATSTIWKVK